MTSLAASRPHRRNHVHPANRYDPWRDVAQNWPQTRVIIETMRGNLLGEVRDDGRLIALRAGTSAAQRRCTLAHEIVHLERGLRDCGPWAGREEIQVHTTAAMRLIPPDLLIAGIRELGGSEDVPALAQFLDVDSETLRLRLSTLTASERRSIRRSLARQAPFWSVA
ncbi:MAG: ImmA/IrrE family metallo-endopeptidase [Jatrophihabitantaceae bacterium]